MKITLYSKFAEKISGLNSSFLILIFLFVYTGASAQTIVTGNYHSAIICTDSSLLITGQNYKGQLGDLSSSKTSFISNALTHIFSVSSGNDHLLALTNAGKVLSWGYNNYGQLGNNSVIDSNNPQIIPNLENVSAVYAGYDASFAVLADGSLWAWGKNNCGQLGTNDIENKTAPVKIQNIKGIKKVAIGQSFTLVLKNDGSVWASGNSFYGQLGSGDKTSSAEFKKITSLSNVIDISAGMYHALAVITGGDVYAWGNDNYGELTQTADTSLLSPAKINSLTGIKAVSCGNNHSLALTETGEVYSFGLNYYGQLGDNSTNNSTVPVLLNLSTTARSIHAGIYQSFCYTNSGDLLAWGLNSENQLGNNTTTNLLVPTVITTSCSILQNANPLCNSAADFTLSDTLYCSGDSLSILNNSVQNLENSWLLNAIEVSNAVDFNAVLSQTGIIDATLTINKDGCSSSKTKSVTVLAKPDATITPVSAMCVNQNSVTITVAEQGGTLSGNGLSGMAFDPAQAGIGTHQLTYTISNSACTSSGSVSIEVLALPNAQITPVSDLCVNQNLITISVAEQGGMLTGNGINGMTFDPSQAGVGTHQITYSISNAACTSSEVTNINVLDLPASDFSFSQVGDSMVFINLSQNGATYSWNFGDNNSSSDFNTSHLYLAGGDYSVILFVENSCGSDTISRLISFIPNGIVISRNTSEKIWSDNYNQQINVELKHDNYPYTFKLIDNTGKVVLERNAINTSDYKVSSKGLANGIYFVSLNFKDKTITKPILIGL